MSLDQASVFLLGSIGYGLGFLFWLGIAVAANNVISKYWKPIRIFTPDSWQINPPQFIEQPKEQK